METMIDGVRRVPGIARTALLLAATSMLLGACAGDRTNAAEADNGGTLVVSTGADADVLIPAATQQIQSMQVAQLIFELLALPPDNLNTFGDEGFTPALAERWTWAPDSLSIAFHLDPGASWHDGRPVRAEDVAFTWQLYVNPETASHSAPLLRNIDSVTVADSLTPVFWYAQRHLEQFFQAAYVMRILPKHLLDTIPPRELRSSTFARNPVGSGPFRFVRWEPGSLIEVAADTAYHRGRPKLDRIIWTIAPDPGTLLTRFFAGEADFVEPLRAESMGEFTRNPSLRAVPYPSLFQVFLLYNTRQRGARSGARPHPVFGDREVRRALTMAIDRDALVRNVYDSLGRVAIGPVNRVMVGSDTALGHLGFDPQRARVLLDSLGWREGRDGIRQKDGRPLRFAVTVPTSSAPRMRMAVLLQEMFRHVGARMDIDQLEFNAFLERQRTRSFDAVIGAWVLDPSPVSIRQMWSAQAATADGANYGAYVSETFDAHLDSAVAELSPAAARAHLRQAYQVLLDDAPAAFLVETVNYAGIHDRIDHTPLRADGWWLTLHRWSIPADRRIARDAAVRTTASR